VNSIFSLKYDNKNYFGATYFPFFLGNFVIKGYSFLMPLQSEKNSYRINKKNIGYHLKNKSCSLMDRWYKNDMLTQVCSVFRAISFLLYFFLHLGHQ
jgi:hypothetical protein